MSDSEMSPASETSDVHRPVRRQYQLGYIVELHDGREFCVQKPVPLNTDVRFSPRLWAQLEREIKDGHKAKDVNLLVANPLGDDEHGIDHIELIYWPNAVANLLDGVRRAAGH